MLVSYLNRIGFLYLLTNETLEEIKHNCLLTWTDTYRNPPGEALSSISCCFSNPKINTNKLDFYCAITALVSLPNPSEFINCCY